MASIADVIDESIRNLTQNMVSKAQQEKVVHISIEAIILLLTLCPWNSSTIPRKSTLLS